MYARTAATVALTASLAVLLTGCGGAAAGTSGGPALGLARGHVITMDDLARTSQQSVDFPSTARAWSSEALREFHGSQVTDPASVTVWTTEVRRELNSARPRTAARPFSAEVMRELKDSRSCAS